MAIINAFLVALALTQSGSTGQLHPRQKPPISPEQEIDFFHKPRTGMNTLERLKSFQDRQRLISNSDFGQLSWRNVGPEEQSGRVLAIKAPQSDPESLYVSFATGGLWRTKDWGITWESLFDHESSFGIGQFALSRDGKTIWVATGEPNSQRTSYQGTGIFKSTDSGKTWQNMGLNDTNHLGDVVINPKNENEVYVAALGHLYTHNSERGVFKTTDGGKTWQHVLKINDRTGVINLQMDPSNPNVLYASAWDRERRAWDFRDSGPNTALYKTTDGGKTWSKLSNGLPSGAVGRIGISIAASQPKTLYAFIDNWNADYDSVYEDEYRPSKTLTPRRFLQLTLDQFNSLDRSITVPFLRENLPPASNVDEILTKLKDKKLTMDELAGMLERTDTDNGRFSTDSIFSLERVTHEIYRSDDGGASWKRTHAYKFGNHGGYYWGEIRVNPRDPNDLVTMGVLMLRSRDGGKTWKRIAEGVHVDFHEFYYDPKVSGRLVLGCDGGPYLSGDDGKTWRHLNNLPVGQPTTLAVDMKTPYNIYVGMQDNGTSVGPSTYQPGRSELHAWKSIFGGDGSWIAVDPRDAGDTVYVAFQFGQHFRVNQKTGEREYVTPRDEPGKPRNRWNWISPLLVSNFHPDILYVGSQRVHRSFDRGKTWTSISDDLTKNRPQGDVPHSTIKELCESPLRFGLLYAGTDDGLVKMTPDGGATWQDVSTPENDKWVTRVVASKWDVNTVYVTQSGYRDDEYRPYVWKSTNMGKSWTSIVGDLPLESVNTIREDPVRKDMLYLGTDMGVYVSYNGGKNWEPLKSGIPNIAVHDLLVHPRDLDIIAATHGRSVFVLSARPLQQLTEEIRAKSLHAWNLPDARYSANWAYRQRPAWNFDPVSEPAATGWIWSKSISEGKVVVKDKDGKVVKEATLKLAKGMQTWSLDFLVKPAGDKSTVDIKGRKPGSAEEAVADPYEKLRAQYLQPGEYTIELSVNGATQTLKWKMLPQAQPQGNPGV